MPPACKVMEQVSKRLRRPAAVPVVRHIRRMEEQDAYSN